MTGPTTYVTGYAHRHGELHAWYQPVGGIRRWVDNDQRVQPEILKGNADLVPAEHAFLDVAQFVDARHPAAPPDIRSELIEEYSRVVGDTP